MKYETTKTISDEARVSNAETYAVKPNLCPANIINAAFAAAPVMQIVNNASPLFSPIFEQVSEKNKPDVTNDIDKKTANKTITASKGMLNMVSCNTVPIPIIMAANGIPIIVERNAQRYNDLTKSFLFMGMEI